MINKKILLILNNLITIRFRNFKRNLKEDKKLFNNRMLDTWIL